MPDGWQQIDAIFQAALARDPADRAAFLDAACAGNAAVRAKVEALLAADEEAQSFIESPALDEAARREAEDRLPEVEHQMLGPYKVVSRIGAGGMGEVYLAKDTRLGRKVALKLLHFELTKDASRVLRFKQEARTVSALNHPNILTIYDIGEVDSVHFIATEFVNGKILRHYIEDRSLAWHETIDIILQVAGALATAHEAGIVHRDIKPENIMIRSDGYAKVLDFGIAKLTERKASASDSESVIAPLIDTEPGMVIGTPTYMSPEQVRGLEVDGRSDIFSLGAVLYEMVAGSRPFAGPTMSDVIAAILAKEPPPLTRYGLDVPEQLQAILTRALQKDRQARYQVLEEMIEDLKRLKRQAEHHSTTAGRSDGVTKQPTRLATGPQAGIETPQNVAGPSDVIGPRPTLAGGTFLRRVTNHKKGAALALVILFLLAMLAFLLYRSGNKDLPVVKVTPHNLDDPSPVKLNVTNEVTLDNNESSFFKMSLSAGEYKVVLDARNAAGRNTNLQGSLSILDQDGGVTEPNVINLNEVDTGYRKVYRFTVKKPATPGFKLTCSHDRMDFWLTFLNASAPAPLPFFGEISPTPIQESQVISGTLDALESVYYTLPLKKGDYKVILDFTNADGRKTNLQGYLALLDEEGGDQQTILRMNEVDVSYRQVAPFLVKKDAAVIIRLKNQINYVKYAMRILPASP